MIERDALLAAAWLAFMAFIASATAGVLRSMGAPSRLAARWVIVCAVLFGVAFILAGMILAFVGVLDAAP